MSDGSGDSEDAAPTDEAGTVLDREELDFTDDERVAELGDGDDRYVVSTGSGSPRVADDEDHGDAGSSDPAEDADRSDAGTAIGEGRGDGPTPERVAVARDTIAGNLREQPHPFGFDATLLIEGHTSRHAVASGDIERMTRGLLQWLALTVDDETPEEEVLGILLLASGVSVRYPTRAVAEYVRAHDLSPDDTIGDLFDAIQGEGGFRIPRETRPSEPPAGEE
ncbi:MAG: hypothetical protein ABEJ30_04425 [Halorientalis sp.]